MGNRRCGGSSDWPIRRDYLPADLAPELSACGLDGCIAVYCRACGASAVRQLLAIGVQPVKVAEAARIDELLDSLQAELREGPSTWLAKAIRRVGPGSGHRFDAMLNEAWDD